MRGIRATSQFAALVLLGGMSIRRADLKQGQQESSSMLATAG